MNKVVVFDLDDTLYKEIDFLKSAYNEIATVLSNNLPIGFSEIFDEMLRLYVDKENVFQKILLRYDLLKYSVNDLLDIYRNHIPRISLSQEVKIALNELYSNGVRFGIITDGRSMQQRNKIKALGLDAYIHYKHIIKSEEFGTKKPSTINYTYFQNLFGEASYYYVGDNKKKDFITPNKLGWETICIVGNGQNIHIQDIMVSKIYEPKHYISSFLELVPLII